jgi:hypothetical protein
VVFRLSQYNDELLNIQRRPSANVLVNLLDFMDHGRFLEALKIVLVQCDNTSFSLQQTSEFIDFTFRYAGSQRQDDLQ